MRASLLSTPPTDQQFLYLFIYATFSLVGRFFSHYVPKLKVGALDDDNIVADKDRCAFASLPLRSGIEC